MPQTIETPSGRKRELPKVLEKIPVLRSAVPSKVPDKPKEYSTALKVAAVPLIPLALLSGCNPFEEPKEKDKSKEVEYVKPLPTQEEIDSQKAFENFFKEAFGVSYSTLKTYGVLKGWGYELHKNNKGGVTLWAGGKEILSFYPSYIYGVESYVTRHVSEEIVKGFLQIYDLVHLQNLLDLGTATKDDLKETDEFLKSLGKDYRKDLLLSELVIINLPVEEYNIEHEYVENVKETLGENESALYVREWDGAIADTSMEFLYTVQARACSILILYDPKTETGALAHISADDMTPANVDLFIKKYVEVITKKGGNIDDVQIYINFGWLKKDSEVILFPLKENGMLGNVIETNLTYKLLGYDPPLFAWVPSEKKNPITGEYVSVGETGSGSIEDSAALDLPTGKIYYVREEDKKDAIKGGTTTSSEHNLGNPTVIVE